MDLGKFVEEELIGEWLVKWWFGSLKDVYNLDYWYLRE